MTSDPAIEFFEDAWTAMVEGDLEQLEDLARRSPFPKGTDAWLGRHWLTSAVHCANPLSLAWVLGQQPEINYVDDEGFTALMSALQVERDCMMTHRNPPKSSEEAAALTIQLIDLLLAAGADINLRTRTDETALHCAASWSSPTVIRHLLSQGANPCVYDSDFTPCSPADNANFAKRWDVAALLREAMEQRLSSNPGA